MNKLILAAIFLLYNYCIQHSCKYTDTTKSQVNKKNFLADTTLKQCISEKDTTIDNANSVSYVIIDSFYTLKVKVGGLDTLLPYQFNCSVPRGLVPSFHSYFNNTIGLIRGHGFDHREFIVAYVNDNLVTLKQYETALAMDLENDIVVYRDYNHLEKVIVEGIKKEGKKTFIIPSKFATAEISHATITKGTLRLQFSDGNATNFPLH